MAEYICVLVVTALIIGFLCGRWRVKEYSGDVIVSEESGSCQLPEGSGEKADQIGWSDTVFSEGILGKISCQSVEKDRTARGEQRVKSLCQKCTQYPA